MQGDAALSLDEETLKKLVEDAVGMVALPVKGIGVHEAVVRIFLDYAAAIGSEMGFFLINGLGLPGRRQGFGEHHRDPSLFLGGTILRPQPS